MTDPVLIDWNEEKRDNFRKGVVLARHRLHMAPEFSDLSLAALLQRFPRDLMDIRSENADMRRRAETMSGRDLLNAIRQNQLAVFLPDVMSSDPVFRSTFKVFLKQLRQLNTGFKPMKSRGGLMIGSVPSGTAFQISPHETVLLQVKGVNRFSVYPPHSPFQNEATLEAMALVNVAQPASIDAAIHDQAAVMDLTPGSFMSWPLHAPQREEALCGLNVSILCEFETSTSRFTNSVLHANGVLRSAGFNLRSSETTSLLAPFKLVLSKLSRLTERVFGRSFEPNSGLTHTYAPSAETTGHERQIA